MLKKNIAGLLTKYLPRELMYNLLMRMGLMILNIKKCKNSNPI